MTILIRFAIFGSIWLVLTNADPSAVPAGILAAGAASFASLRLAPPSGFRVRLLSVPGFVAGFLWRSLLGGIDVASRALSVSPRLDPGFIRYPVALPKDLRRSVLAGEMSLLPGTLSAGYAGDSMYVHCLDLGKPVSAGLAQEEKRIGALCAPSARTDPSRG
ncbi:MAG TPA: Na+/H+ antiporter subunit E [Arenibaculum sp.]|nr:Na+/H+ antiporter subunit E [Arenibaculum sp.]